MGIRSIMKNSFLEQFNSDITTSRIVIMLCITILIGIYVFFVYRASCKKAFYSKGFAISLVVISLITSLIILAIQSSIVISLGMVGALSIVRFRTAIKDPMDLAFLFWSISIGIICGAGLYELAIIGSLVITIAILILQKVPAVSPTMLLIVHGNNCEVEKTLDETISKYSKYSRVKSRNITANGIDMIIELKPSSNSDLIKAVIEIDGIDNASLVEHDGEVTV